MKNHPTYTCNTISKPYVMSGEFPERVVERYTKNPHTHLHKHLSPADSQPHPVPLPSLPLSLSLKFDAYAASKQLPVNKPISGTSHTATPIKVQINPTKIRHATLPLECDLTRNFSLIHTRNHSQNKHRHRLCRWRRVAHDASSTASDSREISSQPVLGTPEIRVGSARTAHNLVSQSWCGPTNTSQSNDPHGRIERISRAPPRKTLFRHDTAPKQCNPRDTNAWTFYDWQRHIRQYFYCFRVVRAQYAHRLRQLCVWRREWWRIGLEPHPSCGNIHMFEASPWVVFVFVYRTVCECMAAWRAALWKCIRACINHNSRGKESRQVAHVCAMYCI